MLSDTAQMHDNSQYINYIWLKSCDVTWQLMHIVTVIGLVQHISEADCGMLFQ